MKMEDISPPRSPTSPNKPSKTDLLHTLGSAASICVDHAEDEGDRVYFGSTNHMDQLREAAHAYQAYQIESGDFGDE
jgi:hypothetical protein